MNIHGLIHPMNRRPMLLILTVLAVSLAVTGCEYLANVATATATRAAGMPPNHAEETAFDVQIVVHIIATHRATESQRQVAEQRAFRAYQRMSEQERILVKRHRYIAVDTVRDKNSQGATSLMRWDPQFGIGSIVYDTSDVLQKGAILGLDKSSAVYVGPGN